MRVKHGSYQECHHDHGFSAVHLLIMKVCGYGVVQRKMRGKNLTAAVTKVKKKRI